MRLLAVLVVFLAGTTGLVWADAAGKDASTANSQPSSPKVETGSATNEHKVGKETVVDYEDGNPDKPIVTGQEGKGIYYFYKHDDSGHKLVTGGGNNGAVTTGAGKDSINTNGGKTHTKGSIIVVKDGKKGAKTVGKNGFISGVKSQTGGGGAGKSNNAGLNFTHGANGFQKANGALTGNLHNNAAMGDGSVRGVAGP